MKKNKRIKIKWKNVALAIVFLICAYVVLHDMFMLTIYSWITGQMVGWTWLGFLTFILAIAVGGEIFEYFEDEFNK